ncbi:MAG TPA: hypothetical protein VE684_17650 [Crenalkalicoccus sp.]|jgi:hypothetical protein|nr:hypothetical protein [Crenalkalicoccus sp.]
MDQPIPTQPRKAVVSRVKDLRWNAFAGGRGKATEHLEAIAQRYGTAFMGPPIPA